MCSFSTKIESNIKNLNHLLFGQKADYFSQQIPLQNVHSKHGLNLVIQILYWVLSIDSNYKLYTGDHKGLDNSIFVNNFLQYTKSKPRHSKVG